MAPGTIVNFRKLNKLLGKPAVAVSYALIACTFSGGITAQATELRGGFTQTLDAPHYNIDVVRADLHHLARSPELIVEVDKIIDSLDKTAPRMFRIELDLFKLDVLAKIEDPSVAASHAEKVYADNPRSSFSSDVEYGDTMYQIVESLAKTDNLGISYDIIQKLRLSLYDNPNSYLGFIMDKSLIEVYMETSDFQHALDLALSVIDNPEFMAIEEIRDWRPVAINEIAYLYNQLEDGENALVYLKEAAQALETQDPSLKKVKKAHALNFANRGRAYLHLKEFDSAREMGKKVQLANKELQLSYLAAVSHRLIGCADFHDGDYKQAEEHLKAGIALAEKDNNLSLKRSLYYDYAMTLEKLGQHKSSALWYKNLYALEAKRQETIAATRAILNDLEFTAFKNHQEMTHLHHELERNQTMNKLMALVIFSLLSGGGILMWLFWNLRKNQRKLMQSEEKAQVANRAKSDFLANMSHEIRTPMNGVLGMAQVLERTPLSAEQKTYLDIVKHSGNTLLDLINDILDFSKIEADKLTLDYKPCNLEQIIQDVVALLKSSADERGIELDCLFAPNLPKYYMLDGKRIRQIVMNLVGNAIKFTPEGSVSVTVKGELKEGMAHIEICVADTGIGIDAAEIGNVFEKFTQAGGSKTRVSGGTGLGLAISHKLSKAMKGDLSVVSQLGEGSSFTFTLSAELAAPASITKEPQALPLVA